MSDEEIKLIAEAHGWRLNAALKMYFCTDHDTHHEGLKDAELAYQGRGTSEWHLTDAGAFRVLVEGELTLVKNNHDGWDCYYAYTEPGETVEYGVLDHNSPHEAIAMARLAQLQ